MAMEFFTGIDYNAVSGQRYETYWSDCLDWREWREAYEGGRIFRDRYLKKFSDREDHQEWTRRVETTPIQSFAKRAINRVRDNLALRFVDIIRRGGPKSYQEAVDGKGRGVDNRGSSMNDFIQAKILSDLLVIGRVGVMVDAPALQGKTAADAMNFQPYIYTYPVEQILDMTKAESNKESDFEAVLLCDHVRTRDPKNGKTKFEKRYKYLWLDEQTGKVNLQYIDMKGKPVGEVVRSELTAIPFVMFDIKQSFMQDISTHQIALLNLSSTITNYALEANFPLFRKQEDGNPFGEENAHPGGKVGDQQGPSQTGVRKGIKYGLKMNPPDFTAPPTGPMTESREYAKDLERQIFELVDAIVAELDPKGGGSMDAGLAYLGGRLQSGEARIADHWSAFENSTDIPVIKYPEEWRIRPLVERLEEIEKATSVIFKFPGREPKQIMAAHFFTRLMRGAITSEELETCTKAIKDSDLATSDSDLILALKEQGALDTETVLIALGVDEKKAKEIATKANDERAERMAETQKAQMEMNAAGRGADDFVADPLAGSKEKEASRNTDDKPTTEVPVRGEGKAIGE